MREEQDPVGRMRTKPREEIAQAQICPFFRNPAELLHGDRVGPRAQRGQQPVAHLLVPGSVGDARPKRHLLLQVGERGRGIELSTRLCAATSAPSASGTRLARDEKQDQEVLEDGEGWSRIHRSCPMLVDSCTNAVITNCEILRFVWRSSLST